MAVGKPCCCCCCFCFVDTDADVDEEEVDDATATAATAAAEVVFVVAVVVVPETTTGFVDVINLLLVGTTNFVAVVVIGVVLETILAILVLDCNIDDDDGGGGDDGASLRLLPADILEFTVAEFVSVGAAAAVVVVGGGGGVVEGFFVSTF